MAKPEKSKAVKSTKIKVKYPIVRLCIKANANNSLITLTDMTGKVIAWSTPGKVGFKGSKKSTPFAAQKATEEVIEKAKAVDAASIHLQINGGGMGRDAFLRAVQASGLQVETIKDTTGFPFGGPKQTNRRRV